ncbi:uncharacterized protein LOC122010939 [Zingiber officinale]|uniref:uncharacterized protein LOC122010939 n=1 Tax=Zingiber officinale TaxID=94328 RepID=UPI001C4C0786|nr:uncharacterized protein LOC122010939 [Zingiber officinale]
MAMEEDFDEAEVLWPDSTTAAAAGDKSPSASGGIRTAPRQGTRLMTSSCPVKIPSSRSRASNLNGGFIGGGGCVDDDKYNSDPPHMVVERRDAATSASPPGIAGREKGLQLCRVRNQVLRMTGFIER